MSAERTAGLIGRWVRLYTRELPTEVAERRREEVDADLRDQIAHGREAGITERRIALGLASRMARGVGADLTWRGRQAIAIPVDRDLALRGFRSARRKALLASLGTSLFLLWAMGAVGIIGAEGDRADLMYFGVLAVGLLGGAISRFRPEGMTWTLVAMAVAQAIVTVIALIAGKHQSPATSLHEILMVNGLYIALFLGSALLFRRAARRRPPAR